MTEFFLPNRSNKSTPAIGLAINDPMAGRLPKSAISTVPIGRCSVVFSDLKRMMVEDGHAIIIPMFAQEQHTENIDFSTKSDIGILFIMRFCIINSTRTKTQPVKLK